MGNRISINKIIYITGMDKNWVIKNIHKFGYITRKGKYCARAKGLEKYLIYSNELDLKENSLYKRLNKKKVNY